MEEKIDLIPLLQRIDFPSIFRDILRQWWVILLLSLSISMVADMAVLYRYKPYYSTSATFQVTSQELNNTVYTNLSTTAQLAQQLTYILESNVMLQKVTKDLDMTDVNASVSVTQIEETNILMITVRADTALASYQIMQSIINNYSMISDYVIENTIMEVIQSPSIPSSPANSSGERRMLERAFLGSLCFFAFLFGLASFLRDTVKNEYDFADKVDAKLLGVIGHEKKKTKDRSRRSKKKVSMLITNPLRSFRYVESIRMTASKIRSKLDKEEAKVILFTSVMENEGKSTVAANIALALAHEKSKVALIDCDFRKPAQYKIFRVPQSITQNLIEIMKSGQSVESAFTRDETNGLYTVFNSTATSSMEDIYDNEVLRKILRLCRKQMDYVILDTSPMALVSETEELAQLCDASVLVVRRDVVYSRDINDAIDALNNTRGKVLGCIFNDAVSLFSTTNSAYGSRYGYGGHYGKRTR